jgi:hypothetical protein
MTLGLYVVTDVLEEPAASSFLSIFKVETGFEMLMTRHNLRGHTH